MSRRREEYRRPEERTLADLLVGHRVILQHLAGPEPDPENPDEEVRGQLQAVTGAYWLHSISQVGIELSYALSGEASEIFFVPWGSVLMLNGLPRTELEREALQSFAIDRQELLERLEDPPPDSRVLVLEARRYLSYNPNDEQVRGALERLPREHRYP